MTKVAFLLLLVSSSQHAIGQRYANFAPTGGNVGYHSGAPATGQQQFVGGYRYGGFSATARRVATQPTSSATATSSLRNASDATNSVTTNPPTSIYQPVSFTAGGGCSSCGTGIAPTYGHATYMPQADCCSPAPYYSECCEPCHDDCRPRRCCVLRMWDCLWNLEMRKNRWIFCGCWGGFRARSNYGYSGYTSYDACCSPTPYYSECCDPCYDECRPRRRCGLGLCGSLFGGCWRRY